MLPRVSPAGNADPSAAVVQGADPLDPLVVVVAGTVVVVVTGVEDEHTLVPALSAASKCPWVFGP
jgi:hypothetical protein